jgi:hypothetical protein
LIYFGYQSLNSSIKRQPGEVQAIRDEIASIRVPPNLEPVAGGHVKVFGQSLGDGVDYAAQDNKSLLILVHPANSGMPANAQNPLIQILAWMGQQQHLVEPLTNVTIKTVERTIRGEPATFEISEGTGSRSGAKRIQLQGTFQGNDGPAILFVVADKDALSPEQLDDVIKSIDEEARAEKK